MEKTSFIMYSMWGEQIEKLSDSQAGKLIKAVFEYAKNGVKPSFDDLALDILFSIICNQLDIDGAKWEDVREKRSQAGKKRWTKNDSENKSNAEQSLANVSKAEQSLANDTVNENDYINENENINDYANENESVNDNVASAGFHEASAHPKEAVLLFGEFGNVRLKDSEHKRLVSDFGKKLTEEYIRKVDEYIEQTGKEYKSCYVTIRKWIDKDDAQNSAEKLISDYERKFFDKIVNQI